MVRAAQLKLLLVHEDTNCHREKYIQNYSEKEKDIVKVNAGKA